MKDPGKDTSARVIVQEIGEVHAAERGSISLTRLPDEFYERATTYLRTMLARIENSNTSSEQVVSEEYYRTTEEYRRGREILTSIYNTRERKIVLMAMNSARKIQQSTENMVHDEMDLFFSLKFELEKIRDRIMKVGHGKTNEPIRGETGINTPITDYNDERADVPKVKSSMAPPVIKKDREEVLLEARDEAGGKGADVSRIPEGTVLVRAVKDISTFMCPDNSEMTMKKDDVALIPNEIAGLLINGGFVEPMEESS